MSMTREAALLGRCLKLLDDLKVKVAHIPSVLSRDFAEVRSELNVFFLERSRGESVSEPVVVNIYMVPTDRHENASQLGGSLGTNDDDEPTELVINEGDVGSCAAPQVPPCKKCGGAGRHKLPKKYLSERATWALCDCPAGEQVARFETSEAAQEADAAPDGWTVEKYCSVCQNKRKVQGMDCPACKSVGACLMCRGWGLADGGLGEGWCPECGGTGGDCGTDGCGTGGGTAEETSQA